MSGFRNFLCFLLICFATSWTSHGHRVEVELRQSVNDHTAIFVFGDSLLDPGNNNFLNVSIGLKANYPPYGETFFRCPTGRHCDGRTIADFIALHANLTVWKPYLQPGMQNFSKGTNFASAGSGVLDETNEGTLNLRKQVRYFKEVATLLRQEMGEEEAEKILRSAVYYSSVGGNDYGVFLQEHPNATESEQQKYIKLVFQVLIDSVKELYMIGARKFAFQNVGSVGCLPATRQKYELGSGECKEILDTMAILHNKILTNVIKELEGQLEGFNYLIYDYFTTLLERIKYPSRYGFKVADVACCGVGEYRGSNCGIGAYELCSDPNDYVFFDGFHPTEHTNSQLAQLLWNGTTTVTTPYNMRQLLELQTTTANNIFTTDA